MWTGLIWLRVRSTECVNSVMNFGFYKQREFFDINNEGFALWNGLILTLSTANAVTFSVLDNQKL
jgi:hypothetical protein